MRDALSLLDQCMGKSEHITEEIVRKTAGLADKSSLLTLTDALISHDIAAAVNTIDELHRSSKDMSRLCDELTEHFRSMMLIKTMKQPRDILVMAESDYEKTCAQSEKLKLADIVDTIDILQSASGRMRYGVNRRIEMEMTAVKLCSENTGKDSSELEKRIIRLENIVSAIGSDASAVQQKPKPSPSSPPVKRPSAEEMEKLRSEAVPMTQWQDVIEDIKKYSRTVAAGFEGSTAYISGKFVLVDSPNDICFELLRKPAQRDKMRDSIKRVTGMEYKLGRYSYPDESSSGDALSKFASDLRSAGVTVEEINKK